MQRLSLSIAALLILLAKPAAAQERPDPALIDMLRQVANDTESFTDHFDAQVWLTDMSDRLAQQVTDPAERIDILKSVHQEAVRADLAPELVLAVIDVESNFDKYAISGAGACGLMQVMPFWLNEIGRPDDNLLHVNTNLHLGCTILKFYLDMEDGDLQRGLGRYNGSLGRRTYPTKVLKKLRLKWFRV